MTPKRRPDCSGLAKSSGCALGTQRAAREDDSRLKPYIGAALAPKGVRRGVEGDAAEVADVLSRAGLSMADAPAPVRVIIDPPHMSADRQLCPSVET